MKRSSVTSAFDAIGESCEGDAPTRPHIPITLAMAVCAWLADAAALRLLGNVGAHEARLMLFVCGIGALVCIAAVAIIRMKRIAICLLGCCLGASLAAGAAMQLHGQLLQVESQDVGVRVFRAIEDPTVGSFGYSVAAQTELASGELVTVRVNLSDDDGIACWSVFRATGSCKTPSEQSWDYYWGRGLCGSMNANDVQLLEPLGVFGAIASFRSTCLALFDGVESDGSAFMQGILFGDRRELFSRPAYGDVKAVGLAHLVAVSGAHLAVIASFASVLLRAARLPRGACAVVLFLLVCLYVVFTGAPKSAIRAAIMTICAASAFFARRRSASMSALGVCVIAMLGADPFLGLSTSFALSGGATLGIIVFARYFSAWMLMLFGGRAQAVADLLGVTFASNLFTIPISIPLFGQLPIVSPLANVVVGPFFAGVTVFGVVGVLASLAVPPFASVLVALMVASGQAMCDAIGLLASVPYACIPATGEVVPMLVAAFLVAALIWAWWPPPRRFAAGAFVAASVVSLAVLLFVAPAMHGDEIVGIDVGQGDAFLIRSGSHALLVDTGTNDTQVLRGLASHGVRALEGVLITHPDDDHCGSLPAILDAMPVGRIFVGADLLTSEGSHCARLRKELVGEDVVGLRTGDKLSFGHFSVTILSPDSFQDEGGNADSIVMVVGCDCDSDGTPDVTALFTGDAESEVIAPLAQQGMLPDVDILKVPHHGSRGGVDEQILDALSPEVSLIGVGEGNRYGHPTDETLQLLDSYGSAVFRTDLNGDIVCNLMKGGISVSTQR